MLVYVSVSLKNTVLNIFSLIFYGATFHFSVSFVFGV